MVQVKPIVRRRLLKHADELRVLRKAVDGVNRLTVHEQQPAHQCIFEPFVCVQPDGTIEVSNENMEPDQVEQAVAFFPALAKTVMDLEASDQARLLALTKLRKTLCVDEDPPIDELLSTGCLSMVTNLLYHLNSKIQFEACWILLNVASGDTRHTEQVVASGAVPAVIRLVKGSSDLFVQEQALWCLGNIAGDSLHHRSCVLDHGGLKAVLQCCSPDSFDDFDTDLHHRLTINETGGEIDSNGGSSSSRLADKRLSVLRIAVWTLSNICRGKPALPLATMEPAIPVLARLLLESDDDQCLVDGLWALSFLLDASGQHITRVLQQPGLSRRLVRLLGRRSSAPIQTAAVRCIGHVVASNHLHTSLMVDAGCVGALARLVTSPRKSLRKEACWALSNLTAGTAAQIDQVLQQPDLLPRIHALMMSRGPADVRREACFVALQVFDCGSVQQSGQLVRRKFLVALCCCLQDYYQVNNKLAKPHEILGGLDRALFLADSATAAASASAAGSAAADSGPNRLAECLKACDCLPSLPYHILQKLQIVADRYNYAAIGGVIDDVLDHRDVS